MSDDANRGNPDDHLIFGADPDESTDDATTPGAAPAAYETRHAAGGASDWRAEDGGYPYPPTFTDNDYGTYGTPQGSGDASLPPWSPPPAEAPQYQQPQYEQPEYQQSQYEQSQYEQPQYEQPVYEQPQYEQPQYEQPAYEAPRYEQPQYEAPRYEQPEYQQPQYEQPQYEQPQYEQPQYEQPGPVFAGQHPLDDQSPRAADPQRTSEPDVAATMRRSDVTAAESPAQAAPLPPQPMPAQPLPHPQPGTQPGPQPSTQSWTPPGQQGPQPRPEDLLVPTKSDVASAPASWGWRGRVNRMSGGMIKSKASPRELEAREAIVRIQRSFSRPMTVVVVQPKGGAGKTPTTICLSAAFGAHRGGYVVGWDDNETRGTLQVRVRNPDNQQATVWDLLSDLDSFERQDARVGDLSYYVRAQPDAHFDALVSDDNPGNMAQIGDDEFQRLHRVLQRFYRMIVVDTGNNVRSANWQAAVNAADLIVVVSTYQRDVGFSASWVLDHLAQTGREELARNAVTVLTAADPTSDKQVRQELLNHFSRRTRAVIEIPYDPELAHGGPIGWMTMQDATRNAWVEAGATVVDALAEQEADALRARRS